MELSDLEVDGTKFINVTFIKQEPPEIENLDNQEEIYNSSEDDPCSLSDSLKSPVHRKQRVVRTEKSKTTNTKSKSKKNPSKNGIYLHSYPNVELIDASESSLGPFTAVFVNDSLSRDAKKAIVKRPASMNRFSCSYCEKTFYHNSEMVKHVRTHTGEKPFHCTYCDKRFGRKSILNAHIRIHTGERPYKCEFCDKTFKDLSNRSIHRRIHTNEKPYVCEYCDKRFYQRSNYIVHTRIHTGIRPYSCNYCDRQFIQKPDLKKHLRIHTGEKPYACVYCEKTFTDKSTCRNHAKIHNHYSIPTDVVQQSERVINFI